MAGAARVSDDTGTVGLMGIAARHRTGDEIDAGVLAIEHDFEIRFGLLIALGQKAFVDEQFGARADRRLHSAGRAVHAANLGGVHLEHRVPLQGARFGDRIDRPQTGAMAGPEMLFHIADMRAFRKEKAMDTVVSGSRGILGMHAAARDDGHVSAFADKEVVVDQVIHIAVSDDGGNRNRFTMGPGQDADIKARLKLFGFDFDVFGRLAGPRIRRPRGY